MNCRSLLAAAWFCSAAALAEEKITFNEHIRPILAENCLACHGPDAVKRKAKRRLDSAEAATALRHGIRGIAPGSLEDSDLWHRITSSDPDEIMPPPDSHKPPLKPEEREAIKQWIQEGAVYQAHWAFEPVSRPAVPAAAGGAGDHAVDRFVGAKLARQGGMLSPEAPPEILLRRVSLDLTGLPPTQDELVAFLADARPGAYERAVDRLLDSAHYGEHFGRHWLDAVRYGDTHGLHLDNIRTIWPYRDWVVRAFNRNLPFDQFTIEQLAGDLLPNPRIDQLVATGYNRCQPTTSEGGAIEEEAEARNTADRVDTLAAVWLGLTANCASCHDHKFDPLTQHDYYALGAFFKGLADRVWDGTVRLPGPIALIADNPQTQQRIEALEKALPPLEAALSARAGQLLGTQSRPRPVSAGSASNRDPGTTLPSPTAEGTRDAVTYEVVWAEDEDTPLAESFATPPPAGEWREAAGAPVASGRRALRLEGRVARPVTFAGGDVVLVVRSAAKAFVHFRPDPAQPPRAVALEFIAENKARRVVWGEADALGADFATDAIIAGPLPPAGAYTRLEIDAGRVGLETGSRYSGLRLVQSDGAAWWDRIGAVYTSPNATEDPLLSAEAWAQSLRESVRMREDVPMRHDLKYLVGISPTQHDESEKKRLARFHREHIHGPMRGALEQEANAVRRIVAEQVHYELTLPATLISRERPDPLPAHVLVRGQYDQRGARVEPASPAFLPPLAPAGARATRLDLARWIVNPRNPLTARVTVNRLWAQLFGAGLVRTPADFGVQGSPPTHPDLLDWLASEFVRTGWDMKRFVRLLVTSRAYRQVSRVTPGLLELDRDNLLLARASRHRLDAEILRDQALLHGGLLRREAGGPPARPYQPPNIWEPVAFGGSNTRVYVADQGAGLYRRSLYTFWKRTAPPPAMTTFDAPSRENACLGRSRSNTPLQALALMNDVQQIEAARAFAERLLARPGSDEDRLAHAFRSVVMRVPAAPERTLLADVLAAHRGEFARDPEAARLAIANGESPPNAALAPGELAAWTMVANLLFNLDEAITRN